MIRSFGLRLAQSESWCVTSSFVIVKMSFLIVREHFNTVFYNSQAELHLNLFQPKLHSFLVGRLKGIVVLVFRWLYLRSFLNVFVEGFRIFAGVCDLFHWLVRLILFSLNLVFFVIFIVFFGGLKLGIFTIFLLTTIFDSITYWTCRLFDNISVIIVV